MLLRTLRVQDLVIIDDLTVEFGPGLNVLTGETGAGKSILVDALSLALGERADRQLVRSGAARAAVELAIETSLDPELTEWIGAHGLDPGDDGMLVLRREVSGAGAAGRAFVNGSPTTASLLRELAQRLVEVVGQHEYHGLTDPDWQLELLDARGDLGELRRQVRGAHDDVLHAAETRDATVARRAERDRRLAELRERLAEIEAVAPKVDELDALDTERRRLRSSGRIAALVGEISQSLEDGEAAALPRVSRAARRAAELAELDPAAADLAGRLQSAALELDDLVAGLRGLADPASFDPRRLEAIESRRAALEQLCLRRGLDEAGLLEWHRNGSEELQRLVHLDSELDSAEAGCRAAEAAYVRAAQALSAARAEAAERLARAVEAQLPALALERGRFVVQLSPARGATTTASGSSLPLSPRGAERVEFLFAANPGQPPAPLRQVASGGERSRLALALRVVALHPDDRRIVVLDEVDAGIGGAVADAVGARLAALATRQQVLCVTHSPQIAAYGRRHFRVTKRVRRGATHASAIELSAEDRVEELARMLAGREPTPTSRRHASEMLEAAGRAAPASAGSFT